MTCVSLMIAMWLPALGEHRGKRSCIKNSSHRCDLAIVDLVPFSYKRGPGGRVGHHVVQDAYIVAIGETLFHIDSLNDGMQLFQGLEIWLGAMKSVEGTLE